MLSKLENWTRKVQREAKLAKLSRKSVKIVPDTQNLCGRPFCQLLAEFEVPTDGSGGGVGRAFEQYLFTRCLNQGKDGILVGSKADIEAQQASCCFCHFVHARIVASGYTDEDGTAQCFASCPGGAEEVWLRLRRANGEAVGGLLRYGERVLFVGDRRYPTPLAGRIVGSGELEYSRVQHWLQLCDEMHHEVCPVPAPLKERRAGAPRLLRVVDVERNCLTEISWQEKYVALSYVWGNASPPRLYRRELDHWRQAHSLKKLRKSMPQTHQDAMHFVAQIGQRYLWFDSLCLIQDDPDDLRKGTSMMDIIYEGAYLTVIAAAGPGADCGLPSVGHTQRASSQPTVSIKPGFSLLLVRSLDKHLNDSVWATRGWTLQEHYLSRRTINFVNNQAYFRCRQRIWSEESWSDVEPTQQHTEEWSTNLVALFAEAMDLQEDEFSPYEYLTATLARFQRRKLTLESDAINAMSGILQRVAHLARTTLLEGLPVTVFPLMLIFLHIGTQNEGGVRRRHDFPSWSWAGWTGLPTWHAFNRLDLYRNPENFLDWPNTRSWIVWFASRNGSCPELLWKPGDAVSRGDASSSPSSPQRTAHHGKPETPQLDVSAITPSSKQPAMPYAILTFFTVTVTLTVRLAKPLRIENHGSVLTLFSLHDVDGTLCGYLYPDGELPPAPDDRYEFILLSECYNVEFPIASMGGDDPADTRLLYWIMLVVWTTGHVYERRGVGHVLHEALQKPFDPGPQWKEIALG